MNRLEKVAEEKINQLSEAVQRIIKTKFQGHSLENIQEELKKNNIDDILLEWAVQKLLFDGKAQICLTGSRDGRRLEFGIISTERELWQNAYKNMKKSFPRKRLTRVERQAIQKQAEI